MTLSHGETFLLNLTFINCYNNNNVFMPSFLHVFIYEISFPLHLILVYQLLKKKPY